MGVRLTAEGETIMPRVYAASDALKALRAVADDCAGKVNHLRVGAYASVMQTWLPEALADFAKGEPRVALQPLVGSRDLAQLLKDGKVDLIICDDWLFEESLVGCRDRDYRVADRDGREDEFSWMPIVDDAFKAVVPSSLGFITGETITRDELFLHPYVFDTEYVYASYVTSDVSSLVKVSADDNASVLSLVASGMGISVLPELSLRNVPDGVCVLQLEPAWKRVLGIVLPPHASSVARRFAQHLAKHVGSAMENR